MSTISIPRISWPGASKLTWACYNDGPDPSLAVRIEEPWITGSSNFIRVFTPTDPTQVGTSQRHNGTAGTGYRIAPTTSAPPGLGWFNFILVSNDAGYVRIEGIEIDGTNVTNAENIRGIMVNDAGAQDDVRISHNLIHDIANSTIDDTDESDVWGIFLDLTSNTKVSNNIVYNIFNNSTNGASNPDGIEVQNVATTFYAYNNTFYNIQNNGSTAPARGINDGASKLVVRNNYVGLVGGLGGGVCFNGPFAAENNNVSSDATAAGAGSQINKSAYASYFVSTTGGSENLHLLNDSFTLWGSFGADLDSDPNLPVTNDIDGGARDATTPDIGADEFGAAGVSLTLANHDVGQVGDQFTTTSSVTAALFRFHLTRTGTVTVDNLRVSFTTGGGIANGDVSVGQLWVDNNNDGAIDGGDTLIQGSVTPSGAVFTFTTDFSPALAGTNYLVRVTVDNLAAGDTTTFSLGTADVDEVEGGVSEFGSVTNAVHTQDAGGVIYYSVGTNAADLKNGTPTVTISSGWATFTVAQPDSIGVGDEITYNGATKAYISGRTSSTVYSVITAIGQTPPDVAGATVNSILRAFNTLTAATTGSADVNHLNTSNLVAGGFQLNWSCYNDGPDPSSQVLIEEPWITGPSNFIRVFAPTGASQVGTSQRHDGTAGSGYRIAPTEAGPLLGSYNFVLVSNDTGYVRIEGIEIDGSNVTNAETVRGIQVDDTDSTMEDNRISYCLIHDITNSTVDDTDASTVRGIRLDLTNNSKVSNNIVYNITNVSTNAGSNTRGILAATAGKTHYIYNNTVYNVQHTTSTSSARGIYDNGGSTALVRNNYVGLVDSALGTEAAFGGTFAAENNNVSFDATAAGAGSQINQAAYASYFVSTTGGSENLHLLNDSFTLWGSFGADLDSDPNLPVIDDIDQGARDAATPDIGADEFGAAGTSLTLADHDVGQIGDQFTGTTPVTAELYRFKLTRSATVNVDNVRVNFTTGTVIDADVTNGELWLDVNNDGAIDGGDTLIQGGVSASGGMLTFTNDFNPGTGGMNYLVRATVANLVAGDATTFSMGAADIDELEVGVNEFGSITDATHTQDVGSGSDISGTVREDVNGDANLADAVVRDNASVALYRDGGDGQPNGGDDTFLSITSTDVSGNYTFASLGAATYWVVVDSKTITPNAGLNGGFVQGDLWAEQTYGVAGAWCDDGTGVATELGVAGPCYGGQVSTVSDDASTLAAAEHVTRVVVVASNVTGVDFGLSFVPVVNALAGDAQDDDGAANRTVQGSLRQCIQNADAVAGANVMRFVPAGSTNATDGGGNNWWQIQVTQALPSITDASTTIDGTAYARSDGVSVLDSNATLLGFVGSVGLGPDALPSTGDEPTLSGVQGPELEIVNDRATNVVNIGLDLQANDLTVRRIAIARFGSGNLFQDSNIRVGVNGGGTNFTGVLIEGNVIGSSAASFTDPGAFRSPVNDIAVLGADGGTIQDNLIGYAGRFGIFLSDTAVGWTVQGNELRANALTNSAQDSLDIGNGSSGATVSGNLFALSDGGGVDSYRGLGSNLIENNTFSQNGQGGTEPAAMRIFGTDNVIRLNDVKDSVGPGVLVVSDIGQQGSPSIRNRISRNRFSGNGSNAIDLLAMGGNASLGDGITLNDGGTDPQAGNIGLDYPSIVSATILAGTTTVTGTTCASCDVEVYKALAGAGDTLGGVDYGEGVELVVSTTADGLGSWSAGGITSLIAGDEVSAITMDAVDNTSEFGTNVVITPADVTLVLADHDLGQVGDGFGTSSLVTDVVFRFKLTRTGTVTVDNLRVNFTTGSGVANGDVSGGELWQDNNNDGVIDGGDTLLQGGVTPSGGTFTFTNDFSPSTGGTHYLARATVDNLAAGDTTTFSLGTSDIDELELVTESGSIVNAVHTQDPGGVIYYSVGTNAADLKSGTPTVTIASGWASFSVAQPLIVGVGDEVTYNGATKAYISGRASSTVYSLTTATGQTPPDVSGVTVNSILRAFNTLTAATTGSADVNHLNTSDLVAGGFQLNWSCYNDGPDPSSQVRIEEPWITGPSNFIRVFTPTDTTQVGTTQRHNGTAGSGYRIVPTEVRMSRN